MLQGQTAALKSFIQNVFKHCIPFGITESPGPEHKATRIQAVPFFSLLIIELPTFHLKNTSDPRLIYMCVVVLPVLCQYFHPKIYLCMFALCATSWGVCVNGGWGAKGWVGFHFFSFLYFVICLCLIVKYFEL